MEKSIELKKASVAEGLVARRRNELVVGKYRLGFQAQRLFMYLLSKVSDEHDENTEYRFSIYELAEKIGIDRTHLYKEMVGAIDELEACKVHAEVLDEDGNVKKNEFARVGLIVNKQKVKLGAGEQPLVAGEITISLHKELLPYVQRLKERYTEIELKYFFRLKSSYSQKLYDLLKARAFMNQAWRIEREELRALLGIEEKEYTNWGDFRRFVLERAQADIGAHTDLSFDIEYVKVGQVINELVFRLRKEGGSDVEVLPGTDKHKVYTGLVALGFSAKDSEQMLKDWWSEDPQRLIWHLKEAKRMKAAGKIDNAAGWFRAGIKSDYRPNRQLFEDMRKTASERRQAFESAGGSTIVEEGSSEVRGAFKGIGSY